MVSSNSFLSDVKLHILHYYQEKGISVEIALKMTV